MSCRRGTSLLELMIVLLILGLVAGIAGGTITSNRAGVTGSDDSVLADARLRAAREGQPLRILYHGRWLLFLPDGQARGAGLDPLTGAKEQT